jgi:hypothetical protein
MHFGGDELRLLRMRRGGQAEQEGNA